MRTTQRAKAVKSLLVLTALAVTLAGIRCGSEKPTSEPEYGEVKILVGAGVWEDEGGLALGGGPVPLDEIESFLLDVDRIILKTLAEGDSCEQVVVFDAVEGPAVDNEVDLVDLTNLSDILSSAVVPPDHYGHIRMEISDPRLNLVGDPVGEYRTNVSLTANGRLFASVDLGISSGETVYLRLALERIHLVEKGNGDFVLTPQLGVEILPEL